MFYPAPQYLKNITSDKETVLLSPRHVSDKGTVLLSPRHVRDSVKLKAESGKLELSVIWVAIGEVGADASVGPRDTGSRGNKLLSGVKGAYLCVEKKR